MASAPPESIEDMKLAVGTALLDWSQVENSLAVFLQGLMQTLPSLADTDLDLAPTIYFAPSNTETRIYIVDAVANHVLNHTPNNFGKELWLCWQQVLARINKTKESRNKLAHGQVIEWHASGIPRVRLTASIYDISRFRKEPARQLPGLSLNDVNQIGKKFLDISNQIGQVDQAARAIRFHPFVFPASRNRVRELAIHLKTSVESLGVRFEKGLPAQPQPFEEWERLDKK